MTNTDKKKKNRENLIIFQLFLIPVIVFCVLQFQTVADSHGDTHANRGGIDGRTSGQAQRPATVLPVYMNQDRLTLAVLTLLLGGWLAFALTYPVVSVSYVYLLLRCMCV